MNYKSKEVTMLKVKKICEDWNNGNIKTKNAIKEINEELYALLGESEQKEKEVVKE